ncbi:MAG: sulfur oxidation c-type cytochrome SoxA [Gammaproteobacteria bacterium]|nr:sulfur oxidation c-type cytochrome SoxA [Gammaproteobacteria bacterium]
MNKLLTAALALGLLSAFTLPAQATPEEDLEKFQSFFHKRFPNTPKDDFINGVYSIDAASREQWESMEEFPPYELSIDKGKELFNTPFKNGKTYASCFENNGIGIAHRYPFFDTNAGEVITLELAINRCREANGEKPLKYKTGDIADISAYMHFTSRGETINIVIPDDPRALAAYERGKKNYFAKRGQMNVSCADCHIHNAGNMIRADLLGPGLGQTTHWPVYRSKWGGMGTLQRRYTGCNKQVRAKPYKAQSPEYRALEYFHSYMSNGLKSNGPGSRK